VPDENKEKGKFMKRVCPHRSSIDARATACPNCARDVPPVNYGAMRLGRIAMVAIGVAAVIALSNISGGNKSSTTTTPAAPSSSTSARPLRRQRSPRDLFPDRARANPLRARVGKPELGSAVDPSHYARYGQTPKPKPSPQGPNHLCKSP
jgi:hypothetical protein